MNAKWKNKLITLSTAAVRSDLPRHPTTAKPRRRGITRPLEAGNWSMPPVLAPIQPVKLYFKCLC